MLICAYSPILQSLGITLPLKNTSMYTIESWPMRWNFAAWDPPENYFSGR
jgi:hypothetical protein